MFLSHPSINSFDSYSTTLIFQNHLMIKDYNQHLRPLLIKTYHYHSESALVLPSPRIIEESKVKEKIHLNINYTVFL